MKVIFCTFDGKNIINGVNSWLIRLLPILKEKGFDIQVIIKTWVKEEECTTLPLLRMAGITCYTIPYPHYTEREIRWILQFINKEKPDIFVPNSLFQGFYASKWIKEAGIPTIGVLHNDDAQHQAIIAKFVNGKKEFNFSAVVAVSSILEQKIHSYANKLRIKKIPCGVNIPENKSQYVEGETFKVVYIGRISREQKRIDKIITAFCEIVNAIENTETYIYGSGPDEALVREIWESHAMPQRVYLMGRIPNEDIQKVLLSAQVVVLLSEYEGIPVAIMEAMAHGVVPISTKMESGISELILENKTGFLIEKQDELIEKIKLLKTTPLLWENISQQAKIHISQSFSIEKCAEDWISLFNELHLPNKSSIKIPGRIHLPPVDLVLAPDDNREPSVGGKIINKLRNMYYNKTK